MFIQRCAVRCCVLILLISVYAAIGETVPSDAAKTGNRVKRATPKNQLTHEQRVDFLTAHNSFRRSVNPPASNMQFVVWHEDLADMAQEWAERCVWQNGEPIRDPKPFDKIGQNKYATTDTKSCQDYTQVVWASSSYIGCAIMKCSKMTGIIMNNATFFVCYYGPGGNGLGKKPYKDGAACSSCPSEMICDSGLCVNKVKCEEKICENGGTIDEFCECICPPGYNGTTCNIGGRSDGANFQISPFWIIVCILRLSI
ncbi:hypothetical protein LSH36_355g00008 [Paralvinella palmiformis]|uniref:EGF-like domain-containing protein n=1 Tax=Paralvinella palmiformis TaxID=53620 RepID=A0AAD9JFB5_9ANNE|nr:hypothetical protein LSH36_355g00008 [Paralvinella palmiformis]